MGHPDPRVDVAALPILPILEKMTEGGAPPFFRSVSSEISLSSQLAEGLDALENVIFIGYPNGIFDSRNLLPVTRRGTTATPISVGYEGSPSFLIDASIFPGSSGSPVFLLDNGSCQPRGGGLAIGS